MAFLLELFIFYSPCFRKQNLKNRGSTEKTKVTKLIYMYTNLQVSVHPEALQTKSATHYSLITHFLK